MNTRIWLSPPHTNGKELEFIHQAFEENWIAPVGPHISGFEQDLAAFIGKDKRIVALQSGTAALHLALIMLGIKRNDRVICQTLTFAASANPINYLGAHPVFVDSERETWNLSPVFLREAIEDCIRKGHKPKAIIGVDLYGMPAQWDEIRAIGTEFNIPIIEDAAEALGSTYKNQACGTFGEMAVLSFNGNKIITTSGGGALICSSEKEAEQARFLASQARDQAPHYQHSVIGYNYRISNISAGIGRGQMLSLTSHIECRRKNNILYKEKLSGIPGITFLTEPDEKFHSNHWLTCILVDPDQTGGITREDIRLKLNKIGIESRPLWKAMHLQPVFEHCPFYGDGTAENLFSTGLCLPSGSNLQIGELTEITDLIRSLF